VAGLEKQRINYVKYLTTGGNNVKQSRTGPEGSRSLRFPDFNTEHEGGKVVSPTHRPPLPPRKYSWYSFLLDDESTAGP